MKITEVLQGLSNLGGEMPRVRNPKKIKKIQYADQHGNKNFKEALPQRKHKKKGPLNIDLSKLGGKKTEGKSPHKKGSAKYKKHMAAKHAAMGEEKIIRTSVGDMPANDKGGPMSWPEYWDWEQSQGEKKKNRASLRYPNYLSDFKMYAESLKEKYSGSKYAKTSDPIGKPTVKPSTGHESPSKLRGKYVGEADDEVTFNNPELNRAAKRDKDINKEFAIGNFFAWAMKKYPKLTLGQMKARFPSLQREYGQEKTMRRVEPNKVPTVSSAFDDEKERMKTQGIEPKTSFESFTDDKSKIIAAITDQLKTKALNEDDAFLKRLGNLVDKRVLIKKGTDKYVMEHKIPFNQCPKCGGEIIHIDEAKKKKTKKDACYHKVKSRYKVWPSAYASGALVQCRNKGAKNWGNKSKK